MEGPQDSLQGAYAPDHRCPEIGELPMGTHHVDTPSGYHRDIELPDPGEMARCGEIPNPLEAIAVKVETNDFADRKPTPQERREYQDLTDNVLAVSLRPPVDVGFVRGRDGKGTRIEPRLPREDRDYLWEVCLRTEPVGAAREKVMKTQADLLSSWASFREGQNGAGVLADVPGQERGPGA